MSRHHKELLLARRNKVVVVMGVLLLIIWGSVMFFTDYFYKTKSLESEQVLDLVSQQLDGALEELSSGANQPVIAPEQALEATNQAVLNELQDKLEAQIQETN